MNILPTKSWHVLKRDNIERVRKDEAQAAEEEKLRLKKVALAEQEHRTSILRTRAQRNHVQSVEANLAVEDTKSVATDDSSSKALVAVSPEDELRQHVNFFRDAEQGKSTGGVNKDNEAEKKAQQEEYEKKIGLLTYLGQSSAESQTVKPWYFTARQKAPEEEKEQTTDLKRKDRLDPMHDMNQYLGVKRKRDDPDGTHRSSSSSSKRQKILPVRTSTKLEYTAPVQIKLHKKEKHKRKKDHKHKKHGRKEKRKHKDKRDKRKTKQLSESTVKRSGPSTKQLSESTVKRSGLSIEQLRAERLRREAWEKARTRRLLSGEKEEKNVKTKTITEEADGKYNSQFHPEIARKRRQKRDFVL